jgi:hypothetical protein
LLYIHNPKVIKNATENVDFFQIIIFVIAKIRV